MNVDFMLSDWLPALINWDKSMTTVINTDWGNSFFDMIAPTWRSRSVWIPVYALISVLVIRRYKMSGVYVLGFIGVTMVVANLISSEIIKEIVQRTRPCNDSSVQFRTLMECSPKDSYSFTSSHATNHFALSVIMYSLIPFFRTSFWKLLLLAWAASIAYMQVYVGRHFVLDVVCGAMLGTSIAYLMAWLFGFLQRKFIIPAVVG